MAEVDWIPLLRKRYLDALERYRAFIDKDGDIVFIHPDMGTFYIYFSRDNGPEFLNMNFLNFTNTQEDRVTKNVLLAVANKINYQNKVVKMTVSYQEEQNIWVANAAVQAFVAGPDELPSVDLIKSTLQMNVGAIRFGIDFFRCEQRELLAEQADPVSPLLILMPSSGS